MWNLKTRERENKRENARKRNIKKNGKTYIICVYVEIEIDDESKGRSKPVLKYQVYTYVSAARRIGYVLFVICARVRVNFPFFFQIHFLVHSHIRTHTLKDILWWGFYSKLSVSCKFFRKLSAILNLCL